MSYEHFCIFKYFSCKVIRVVNSFLVVIVRFTTFYQLANTTVAYVKTAFALARLFCAAVRLALRELIYAVYAFYDRIALFFEFVAAVIESKSNNVNEAK